MSLRDQFLALEQDLQQTHIDRADAIRGLLVALLSRQHVVLLGPPGTGKTRLAHDLCTRIHGQFFEWQLNRLSTPEELFGPLSLTALQQDHYRRVTAQKLPEADIAYVDEIFKASSALLNALLSAMNERVFYNDGQAVPIPLMMLVGASNELPEDRDELGALWDRFGLRYVVDYLKDDASFAAMLQTQEVPTPTVTLTLADVATAQQDITHVDVTPLIPLIGQLRSELVKAGVVASDRRWRQSLKAIQAQAWLNGHAVATEHDAIILQHILWQEPDQRLAVAKMVMAMINPFDQKAQDIIDDVSDAFQQALQAPEDQAMTVGLEFNNTVKAAIKRLNAIREESEAAGRPSSVARQGILQLKEWSDRIVKTHLQISI